MLSAVTSLTAPSSSSGGSKKRHSVGVTISGNLKFNQLFATF